MKKVILNHGKTTATPRVGKTNTLLDKNKRIEIPPKNKLNLQLEISLSSCRYPDN